jgi:hypothetical protein
MLCALKKKFVLSDNFYIITHPGALRLQSTVPFQPTDTAPRGRQNRVYRLRSCQTPLSVPPLCTIFYIHVNERLLGTISIIFRCVFKLISESESTG